MSNGIDLITMNSEARGGGTKKMSEEGSFINDDQFLGRKGV